MCAGVKNFTLHRRPCVYLFTLQRYVMLLWCKDFAVAMTRLQHPCSHSAQLVKLHHCHNKTIIVRTHMCAGEKLHTTAQALSHYLFTLQRCMVVALVQRFCSGSGTTETPVLSQRTADEVASLSQQDLCQSNHHCEYPHSQPFCAGITYLEIE